MRLGECSKKGQRVCGGGAGEEISPTKPNSMLELGLVA